MWNCGCWSTMHVADVVRRRGNQAIILATGATGGTGHQTTGQPASQPVQPWSHTLPTGQDRQRGEERRGEERRGEGRRHE